MKFEQAPKPQQLSEENIGKIEKERVLSDAELIKGGAEYTFNEKGEMPAFQLEDAGTYVIAKKRLPFDFIVRDSEGEQIPMKSSHPQIRPAFVWEEQGWYVHRLGSTSVETVVKQGIKSDLPIFYLEGATYASRAHPNDFDITPMVFEFMRKIDDNYSRRHPPKGVCLVIKKIGDKITSIVRKAA